MCASARHSMTSSKFCAYEMMPIFLCSCKATDLTGSAKTTPCVIVNGYTGGETRFHPTGMKPTRCPVARAANRVPRCLVAPGSASLESLRGADEQAALQRNSQRWRLSHCSSAPGGTPTTQGIVRQRAQIAWRVIRGARHSKRSRVLSPTQLPRIYEGGIPACSNASDAISSNTRCPGSICAASLGENTNNTT